MKTSWLSGLFRGRRLFVWVMACIFGLALAASADDGLKLVFVDDFSDDELRWEIVWDPNDTIRKAENYLLFGDMSTDVHMRVPDVVTDRFDFVMEVDLNTGSPDWIGVRFGTTENDPWYHGHLLMIRPNGLVQFFEEIEAGELKREEDVVYLGQLTPFTHVTDIEVRVRPNRVELEVYPQVMVIEDVTVNPGYIELFASKPGPVKLYYTEVYAAL